MNRQTWIQCAEEGIAIMPILATPGPELRYICVPHENALEEGEAVSISVEFRCKDASLIGKTPEEAIGRYLHSLAAVPKIFINQQPVEMEPEKYT